MVARGNDIGRFSDQDLAGSVGWDCLIRENFFTKRDKGHNASWCDVLDVSVSSGLKGSGANSLEKGTEGISSLWTNR